MVIINREIGQKIRGIGVKRNKAEERRLITKMLQYSAMKISANFPPPYSMLNPETSSDSPSAKSNGARFVSARRVTNHAMKRGGIRRNKGVEWFIRGVVKLNESRAVSTEINRRAIEISYEIVWAILRVVPRRAYFLLEDQPAINVGYTFKLEVVKKARVPNGRRYAGNVCG